MKFFGIFYKLNLVFLLKFIILRFVRLVMEKGKFLVNLLYDKLSIRSDFMGEKFGKFLLRNNKFMFSIFKDE